MVTSPAKSTTLARRAYRWIFASGLVSALLGAFLQPQPRILEFDAALAAANARMVTLCLSPVTAAAGVLPFALVTGVTQRIARLYGGSGTYAELAHAFATYQAPLSPVLVLAVMVLSNASGRSGMAGNLVLLLAGLGLCALNAAAIRRVNLFGWREAVLTQALVTASVILLTAVLSFILMCLLVIARLAPAFQGL